MGNKICGLRLQFAYSNKTDVDSNTTETQLKPLDVNEYASMCVHCSTVTD